MKTIRLKELFWIVFLAFLFSGAEGFSNQYDSDEQTRRAAEKLVELDKAEREAAKQRYEREHGSGGSGFGLFGMAIIGCLVLYIIATSAQAYDKFSAWRNSRQPFVPSSQFKHLAVDARAESKERALALAQAKLPARAEIIRTTFNGWSTAKDREHRGEVHCVIYYKTIAPVSLCQESR